MVAHDAALRTGKDPKFFGTWTHLSRGSGAVGGQGNANVPNAQRAVNAFQPSGMPPTRQSTPKSVPAWRLPDAIIMSTKPVAHQVVPGARGAESAAAEEGAVRPRDSLFHWCGTADAIRTTTSGPEKRAILDAYFVAVAEETVVPAARFFAGAFFPPTESETRRIEGTLVADAIRELAPGASDGFPRRGKKPSDIASVAADVFAGRLPSGIAMSEVDGWANDLAATTDADAQRRLVGEMLARLSSLEARYVVQLIVGDLDVGLDSTDIERALEARRASSGGERRPDRRRNTRRA